jgi:hypothetical protein
MYQISSDYELMLRLYTKHISFVFLENVLANFRLGGISVQQNKKRELEKLKIQKSYGIISSKKYWIKQLITFLS